jgi:hypothetical protein
MWRMNCGVEGILERTDWRQVQSRVRHTRPSLRALAMLAKIARILVFGKERLTSM